jgi:hypothetical protein
MEVDLDEALVLIGSQQLEIRILRKIVAKLEQQVAELTPPALPAE